MPKHIVSVFDAADDPWPREIAELEYLGTNADGFRVYEYDNVQYASTNAKAKICLQFPVPKDKQIKKIG